jgi:acetyltransferase-like isoleucine patch superfamily enzyme
MANVTIFVSILVVTLFFLVRILLTIQRKNYNVLKVINYDQNNVIKREKRISFVFSFWGGLLRLSLNLLSHFPSHTIRRFFLKYLYLVDISKDVVIYYGFEIRSPFNLHIGNGSIIGDMSILDARNGIWIGENVTLSTGVWLWTEQHNYNNSNFSLDDKKSGIRIENRAWIGPRVIILPNIIIGEGAVVAAGSVVTKNVEPFTIVAGIPAKKIGNRNVNLNYTFNGDHLWFL